MQTGSETEVREWENWAGCAGRRPGPTVLVAEHDPWLRTLLAELLSAEDFVVLPTSNGSATARLAELHRPSAILLDATLPELSGRDLLAHLRDLPATRDIPIVLMAASACGRADGGTGVVSVVRKPFDVDQILRAVRSATRTEQP